MHSMKSYFLCDRITEGLLKEVNLFVLLSSAALNCKIQRPQTSIGRKRGDNILH